MALVLGISVGDVIDVGNSWFVIVARRSQTELEIVDQTGDKFTVSSEYETEVHPAAWVQLWKPKHLHAMRLRIIADKAVPISRRKSEP